MQIPNVQTPQPVQPAMTNAPYYPANDDLLLQQLQQQIDFYFSPENLSRDDYLRTILYRNNGVVPVELIASFPMIKKIVARKFLGPAAVFHTDPLTLPPADCNLLRHAVMLNSQRVMVEGMFFVHPDYHVRQHYPITATQPATPQERFAPVADPLIDHRPSPVPYDQIKKPVSDDVSTRTVATVSPTSFASTLNPSTDEDDDTKSFISVKGVPENIRDQTFKKWLAFDHRKIPEGFAPVFPLSLEKVCADTWKLCFSTEDEARTAVDVLSKRKFRNSRLLVCHFLGGHPYTTMSITMLYQPYALPQGEPVYYASAYPYDVLETAQKGIVALPFSSPTTMPMYTLAYPATQVSPAEIVPEDKVSDTSNAVQEDLNTVSGLQEENISPLSTHFHQPTPDPRFRRKHRNKKYNTHNKNRRKKKDEFPPLEEISETSRAKEGNHTKVVFEETMHKMGELNLSNE